MILFSFIIFFSFNFVFDISNFPFPEFIVPVVYAANANLFVSAESSQFSNYMSGPQVIEVKVMDSDIDDTDEAKGEPDVTVNGRILRMVQAVDGNWYGYFADRNMAQIADSTSKPNSQQGLDFGLFCSSASASNQLGVSFTDTSGVAIPMSGGGGVEGQANGGAITAACSGGGTTISSTNIHPQLNVVREAKDVNRNSPIGDGQIGINSPFWPFVQLYTLNPTGNVVIQYNKGGGAQTTTLTFDTVDQFADIQLDRSTYPKGAEIHATVTDLWLNIDPTDEDSWTFDTTGTNSFAAATAHYQVFDENGNQVGDTADNTNSKLSSKLGALMCEDNCKLITDFDVQNKGPVFTLQDNDDEQIVLYGHDPQLPSDWGTVKGNLKRNVPITITEQDKNSGVFGTYDESDKSNIVITNGAVRGSTGTIEYNNTPKTILVGFSFGSIQLKQTDPMDVEWKSGEELSVILTDTDANKNSRADEDLDFKDPKVSLIPSLKMGNPITLAKLTSASLKGDIPSFNIQNYSDRAMLEIDHPRNIISGDELVLEFGTMEDLYKSTPINKSNFRGYVLLNYDVRSLQNFLGINSVDIRLAGIGSSVGDTFDDQGLQGLILLNNTTFRKLSPSTPLEIGFKINGTGGTIPESTILPVAVDIFGYGFMNDGLEQKERIANQIIRFELEETGDNTGKFEGTLEYTMVNQLNILDPNTYTGLTTIGDDPTFIVMDKMDMDPNREIPRVYYLDLGADGVSTPVADQIVIDTHTGFVSNFTTSQIQPKVFVKLEDLDLNTDSDLIDIFTVVDEPGDANNGAVGVKTVFNEGYSIKLSNGGQLGRLLDVTFDDIRWVTPPSSSPCFAKLKAVEPYTGLEKTGFTLIETDKSSGIFTGSFDLPRFFCRPGTSMPDKTDQTKMEINYVDFRDENGHFKILDPTDKYELKLKSGSFANIRGNQIPQIIANKTGIQDNFFFLQTKHYLNQNERANLRNEGIKLVDFLDGFVYTAKSTDQDLLNFDFTQHPEVRAIFPIEPKTKIESDVFNENPPPWLMSSPNYATVIVFFHENISESKMRQYVTNVNGIPGKVLEGIGAIKASIPYDNIKNKLAKYSDVKFIAFPEPPLEPAIDDVRRVSGIDELQFEETYKLTGKNTVALLFEEESITETAEFKDHWEPINLLDSRCLGEPAQETSRRVENPESKIHANHVAGILGANNNEPTRSGIAPDVLILSYATPFSVAAANGCSDNAIWLSNDGDLLDARKAAEEMLGNLPPEQKHIDVMNISLAHPVNNGDRCSRLGDYSLTAELLDNMTRGAYFDLPSILITQAAGNERRDIAGTEWYSCTPPDMPKEDGFGTIASPGTAKNPIVVGAIYSNSPDQNNPLSHSGFGPTDDGRIKPDVVAYGAHTSTQGIESTGTWTEQDGSTHYEEMMGTSMAAPFVAGTISLISEEWEKRDRSILMPHTVKGILIQAADDLGEIGPDYKYGWGKVNPKKAIDLVRNSVFINTAENEVLDWKENTIIIDSISNEMDKKTYKLPWNQINGLTVTLVWDDPAHEHITGDGVKALVNDLDLRVLPGNGDPIKPITITSERKDQPATEMDDSVNNIEMVKRDLVEGTPTIEISMKEGPESRLGQEFTLIVSAIDPTCQEGTELVNGVCQEQDDENGGGCLVATASYGSELEPQVQFLRESRDNIVMSTSSGTAFMAGFNQLYYSFSPTVADLERENQVFKEMVKLTITPMVYSLSIITLAEEGNEFQFVFLGLIIIIINIGFYIVAPVFVVKAIHHKINSKK